MLGHKTQVNHRGKSYLVSSDLLPEVKRLDMERYTAHKVDQFTKNLGIDKKEFAQTIFHHVSDMVKWSKFNDHVLFSLEHDKPLRISKNIYELQRDIKAIVKKTVNRIRQSDIKKSEKELILETALIGRSLCRLIDDNATCWDSEKISQLKKEVMN